MKQMVRRRPNCEAAYAFEMGFCGDPKCGLHLIALREGGEPICEVIIGRDSIGEMLRAIHDEGLDRQ
ncbi:hypothetical protein [Bradyrhizobium zhanjiangense]|uniref:Uncharacterized protein n=1 Tax=Bradyrhizobium zhanjiangense TaxID=1325107 RepID=A0ABY0DFS9_9BRAD|nr:hypothetical protein [Bradyrhizobium zhanjiangense]RXG91544.1 hypothetical protein EAS62_23985 [Bradyrhizobium zhanjiangense]